MEGPTARCERQQCGPFFCRPIFARPLSILNPFKIFFTNYVAKNGSAGTSLRSSLAKTIPAAYTLRGVQASSGIS
ncbi:hypothetical protein BN2475_370001 [Paraburkholderia ribeironis]|uniref:Uncharacterized protein n=1 Tax=Paraburkholderia ribeironis TaxID=1247936 RepID=A0A1N7S5V3_9BURK|nr:hypothetical protein BN2475_370001 [Paraburkholderia ribeironis]